MSTTTGFEEFRSGEWRAKACRIFPLLILYGLEMDRRDWKQRRSAFVGRWTKNHQFTKKGKVRFFSFGKNEIKES